MKENNKSILRTDFFLEQAICKPHKGFPSYKIRILAQRDLRPLLPYLNAVSRVISYEPEENNLCFKLEGYKVVVTPDQVEVQLVADLKEARKAYTLVTEFLEETWSKRQSITPKEAPQRRPTALEIYKYLPQTNCQECGEPSCLAFALKLSAAERTLKDCKPLSREKSGPRYLGLKRLLPED